MPCQRIFNDSIANAGRKPVTAQVKTRRLCLLDAILTFNEINKTEEKEQSDSQLPLT